MRFLKKINEDFSTSHKQLANDIQDICLELHDTDMEFNVLSNSKYFPVNYSLKGERQRHGYDCISIKIKDNQSRFFRLGDIEEVLLRLRDYSEKNKLNIDCGFPSEDFYLTLEEFWDDYCDEDLYDLTIFIYKV